jgi:hypothetical protein
MAGSTFDSTKLMLSELLDDASTGKLQLPEFQRGWVWDDAHIRDLIASVAVGFPIGAVMLMETGGDVQFKARPIEGVETTTFPPERLILDGQQRLTSLFQSLKSGKVVQTRDHRKKDLERWYYLHIPTAVDRSKDLIDAVRSIPGDKRVTSDFGRKVDEDYSTPDLEHRELMFPLTLIFDSLEWRAAFQHHHSYAPEMMQLWNRFEIEVLENFKAYQLPVITLKKETPREAVCLVFEKVNTGGVALNVFELLTATFAAEEEGFNLREDWERRHRELLAGSNQAKNRSVLAGVSATDFLQALTLLVTRERRLLERDRGVAEPPAISCKRRDVLRLTKADYDQWADQLVGGFIQASRFLHGEHVFEGKFVPYPTQVIPLAALLTLLGSRAEDAGPRSMLRRWYWCGVFGELYGSATETRFANDLAQVLDWIESDSPLPNTVVDANLSPERLERLRTRNSAAYRGLYVLLLRQGGEDWRTGEPANIQNYHDEAIDIHHVFPRKWCRDTGIEDGRANSIINKTPLTSRTNRIIGGDAPSRYLPALAAKSGGGPEQIDASLRTHLIDPGHLRADDFERFWEDRKERLLSAVASVMGKELRSDQGDRLAEDEPDDDVD